MSRGTNQATHQQRDNYPSQDDVSRRMATMSLSHSQHSPTLAHPTAPDSAMRYGVADSHLTFEGPAAYRGGAPSEVSYSNHSARHPERQSLQQRQQTRTSEPLPQDATRARDERRGQPVGSRNTGALYREHYVTDASDVSHPQQVDPLREDGSNNRSRGSRSAIGGGSFQPSVRDYPQDRSQVQDAYARELNSASAALAAQRSPSDPRQGDRHNHTGRHSGGDERSVRLAHHDQYAQEDRAHPSAGSTASNDYSGRATSRQAAPAHPSDGREAFTLVNRGGQPQLPNLAAAAYGIPSHAPVTQSPPVTVAEDRCRNYTGKESRKHIAPSTIDSATPAMGQHAVSRRTGRLERERGGGAPGINSGTEQTVAPRACYGGPADSRGVGNSYSPYTQQGTPTSPASSGRIAGNSWDAHNIPVTAYNPMNGGTQQIPPQRSGGDTDALTRGRHSLPSTSNTDYPVSGRAATNEHYGDHNREATRTPRTTNTATTDHPEVNRDRELKFGTKTPTPNSPRDPRLQSHANASASATPSAHTGPPQVQTAQVYNASAHRQTHSDSFESTSSCQSVQGGPRQPKPLRGPSHTNAPGSEYPKEGKHESLAPSCRSTTSMQSYGSYRQT